MQARAILEAAGQRVHVYTSPNLVRLNERFRISRAGSGRLVDDDELAGVLAECEAATRFEKVVAAPIAAVSPTQYLLGMPNGPGGFSDSRNWGMLQRCQGLLDFLEGVELKLQDSFAAVDFFEATTIIKQTLRHAKVSGGVSNVSFSFRGNNPVREAIHTAFLYHAIRAGLDMAIVNAGMLGVYQEIPPDLLERVSLDADEEALLEELKSLNKEMER